MKSNNGTNFSHFEKCSIVTKTDWFYLMIKQNGLKNPNSISIQAPWCVMAKNEMYTCIKWSSYPITHQTLKNKLLNLKLHPLLQILCLEWTIGPLDPKMAQLFINMPQKVFTFL
jgi:hypothetical protein